MQTIELKSTLDLSILPVTAQQEIIDFYGFLIEKYTKGTGNDLSSLAGTWSNEELVEFNQATKQFEQIDEELWK